MAVVVIPALFRQETGGTSTVTAAGANLLEVIRDVERQFPALKGRIVDEGGIRPEVFLALRGNEERNLKAAVGESDEVHILPAIAGGACDVAFAQNCDGRPRLFVLGEQLRLCRLQLGLTQAQIAQAAGTSQARISRVEADLVVPRVDELLRICAALDADVEIHILPRVGQGARHLPRPGL